MPGFARSDPISFSGERLKLHRPSDRRLFRSLPSTYLIDSDIEELRDDFA